MHNTHYDDKQELNTASPRVEIYHQGNKVGEFIGEAYIPEGTGLTMYTYNCKYIPAAPYAEDGQLSFKGTNPTSFSQPKESTNARWCGPWGDKNYKCYDNQYGNYCGGLTISNWSNE